MDLNQKDNFAACVQSRDADSGVIPDTTIAFL